MTDDEIMQKAYDALKKWERCYRMVAPAEFLAGYNYGWDAAMKYVREKLFTEDRESQP